MHAAEKLFIEFFTKRRNKVFTLIGNPAAQHYDLRTKRICKIDKSASKIIYIALHHAARRNVAVHAVERGFCGCGFGSAYFPHGGTGIFLHCPFCLFG